MTVQRNCLVCNSQFSTSRVGGVTAKLYCSRECKWKEVNADKRLIPVERNCLGCGAAFITNKINGDSAKIYCSRKCERLYLRKAGICIDCYKPSGRVGGYLCNSCKSKSRARQRLITRDNRLVVLQVYGNECSFCKIAYAEFLAIDHINGLMGEKRRVGKELYSWLIRNNYPKDNFQLLCHNCNMTKRLIAEAKHYNNKKYRLNSKQLVFDYYRPFCHCCGISDKIVLTLDHINGGGCAHRREDPNSNDLWTWVRLNGFPPQFQILCFNCNLSKGFYGYCPHTLVTEYREVS